MNENEISELKQKKNILGKISGMFINRFRVVYLIVIGIILAGYIVYTGMPREEMPEVSINMIYVSVSYQGVSANDMESLITDPLESALENIEGLDTITSTTKTGSTAIMLRFDGEDMDDAMTHVRDKVSSTSMPAGVRTPMISEIKTSEMPIMRLTVTGDVSMTQLKHYGEVIEEKIESVAGIDSVDINGGYTREIQVKVKQSELTKYGLNINNITNSISGSDVSMPINSMDLEGENYNLRIDESIESIEDISNIVVSANKNSYILLKDIAVISDSFKTPTEYSYYYTNDGVGEHKSKPAIYIQVYRDDGYDMLQPCLDITNLVVNEKSDFLPESINVVVTEDSSIEVKEELDTVFDSAISGFIVVIIVLFLFIGLNEALIVASVIPLSLLIAVIFLDLSDMTFNTLTLTGFIIALGLLVDNAIVILENVDRLRDLGVDRITASKVGGNQVAPAVFAASLTTIVAFLPLLIMEGTIGDMIRALPLTIVFSIIASFLVSIMITPVFCARFLSKYKGGHKRNLSKKALLMNTYASTIFVMVLTLFAFNDFGLLSIPFALGIGGIMYIKKTKFRHEKKDEENTIANQYKKLLSKIITNKKRKVFVVISSIIIFFLSISVLITGIVSFELFPTEDPRTLTINLSAPDGYLLDDTREIIYKIEEKLYQYDDIQSFNSSMGSSSNNSFMGSGTTSSNEGKITLELKDDRNKSGIEMMALLREDIKNIAGGKIEIEASLSKGPSSEDISVSLKGDNIEVLDEIGEQYYEELKSINGIINPDISSISGARALVVKIDNLRAAQYGYTPATISQEIRNKINGIRTISFTEQDEDEEIDVTLYVDQDIITSIRDFEKIYFTNQRGEIFNFNEVARIEVVDAVNTISHEDGQNVVTISADVDPDYNVSSIMRDFNEKTEGIVLPKGVEKATGGGFGDMTDTFKSMLLGLAAAILLVYLILAVQFNSLHQPLVILFSVPLAIIGVMFGLMITGNNLGIYAMMGVIALVGIAVNDAIVLIDYMNYLRKEGMEKSEAILEGVKTRFTPVFATSITTIGGILPMAVFNKTYGQLGIALIFGLITSTLLTLLVIPVLYSGLDSIANKIKGKTGIFKEEKSKQV